MKIDEFDELINNAEKPIVVDFWAPWCAPCRMMNPVLESMGKKYQDKIDVVKINSDESPDLIRKLGVMSIPTLMGYLHGQVAFRRIGVQPTVEVERLFASLAGNVYQPGSIMGKTRLLRAGLGFGLIAIGIFTGPLYWLIGVGGLVLFSAIYDRCPIYKAVAPRIIQFIKRFISLPKKTS